MAKQIEGVYERILECAKKEFLEKGYTDASLRTIAAEAETSTNSIYVRFKDKEGLFAAIVEPVSEEFMSRCLDVQETFHSFDSDVQRREVGKYSSDAMLGMVDYIYDHFDEFRLLLDASHGTKFCNFVNGLVSMEEADFYHMMVTAYFEGIFEVVRHGMDREDAKKYVAMMGKYHHGGFLAIVGEETAETK